jgi:thiosulfate/3-mercaptopyruvate sulfurtransferase
MISQEEPAGGRTQAAGAAALVDAATLKARIGSPDLCILDCRFDLASPRSGREQYRQGHIPGAVYADLEMDLSGPKDGSNGRHPLPRPQALAARLRSWGAGRRSWVVAYDASEGCYAARAWWLLRWLGHESVCVLDGGWQAWLEAGGAVSAAAADPEPGDFEAGAPLQSTVGAQEVLRALSRAAGAPAQPLVVDARAPDRYEGRNETLDPVGGHIPGAVSRFWKLNLDPRGRLKPSEVLRGEYQALLGGRAPAQAILQCGSGVTACHDLLAMHLAGLPGAALFAGSWSEWVSDPSRPVARGPLPGGLSDPGSPPAAR